MTARKIWWFATVFTLFCCFTGCNSDDHYAGKRTTEDTQRLQALNDSMLQMSPGAVKLIREAMATANDSLTWYDYYITYGRRFLLTSTPDSLLPYAERVLRFTASQEETPRTRGLAAKALSGKASYYHLLYQQPDTVIKLYTEAYRLMMQSDSKQSLPDLSANLADGYVTANNLPEAAKWYRRAIVLVDSLGLPDEQNITLYMGLGRIYTNMRDFTQAQESYQKAEQRYDEMKPNMQSYFLNNYGNFYYYHREYDKALQMFLRMKAHLEQHHSEENFDMYLCKINLADVYLNLGRTDSARAYVNEVEPYFVRNRVNVGIHYANTIRIGIALQEKNYDEVKRILDSEELTTSGDDNINGIRNTYLSRYYSAIGDYRRAYAILQSNASWKDSTDYSIKRMRSAEIMNRLTEDTIRLHHQLELDQREIHYARTRALLWMLLGILLAAVLLFVVWYYRERRRRLQEQLNMVTLRIANARQRISPHFVFNVLNSHISNTSGKEAESLIMMSKLIRSNLDMSSRNYVTLAEELDFVRQYVAIERMLIGEDFEFTVNAPEHELLRSIMVPSMLIQILVENAILHGLKNQLGHKVLTITVDAADEETRISVTDNGPGFDIRQYNSERSRTGLNIIRTTISSINQENKKLKMRFDIHNDNGCHATITIPKNIKLI
jgi:tetratricopeptide (TPR) repeat protein